MKSKLRIIIKTFLYRFGIFSLLIRFEKKPKIRILMYHGICERSIPPELLEQQLSYINKNFDVYWASEIPQLMQNKTNGTKPPLVLTFDDGCVNNAVHAAPLLKKHNVKATFYIISRLLDGDCMLWNHEMRCRIHLLSNEQLPDGVGPFPLDEDERENAIYWFVRKSKNWTSEERTDLLDKLRAIDPVPQYENWMIDTFALMNTEQLQSLPDVVEVGSHTMTHPLLDQIPKQECIDEIATSRVDLERILGKPVSTFCYPNGNFSDEVLNAVKQNYDVAVTVENGITIPTDDPHKLKRIAISEDPIYEFAFRLART